MLGLATAKLDAAPTTAYLMTYHQEKCTANCIFCPQARDSQAHADLLSRITWPIFPSRNVLEGIVEAFEKGLVKRICIQALNYSESVNDICCFIEKVKGGVDVPISVSCQPSGTEELTLLKRAGTNRIGIPLDAATKDIFERTKGYGVGGPYIWDMQWQLLAEATGIFGKNNVSTHLIVGLGETDKEMVEAIQKCIALTVLPALFAFTPIPHTGLAKRAPPEITRYRQLQLARHLIVHGISRYENMKFDEKGNISEFGLTKKDLLKIVYTSKPFLTSGCPDCNRPFYNEKPSGPIFNYPRMLSRNELLVVRKQIGF
jgi:biotin synthase